MKGECLAGPSRLVVPVATRHRPSRWPHFTISNVAGEGAIAGFRGADSAGEGAGGGGDEPASRRRSSLPASVGGNIYEGRGDATVPIKTTPSSRSTLAVRKRRAGDAVRQCSRARVG